MLLPFLPRLGGWVCYMTEDEVVQYWLKPPQPFLNASNLSYFKITQHLILYTSLWLQQLWQMAGFDDQWMRTAWTITTAKQLNVLCYCFLLLTFIYSFKPHISQLPVLPSNMSLQSPVDGCICVFVQPRDGNLSHVNAWLCERCVSKLACWLFSCHTAVIVCQRGDRLSDRMLYPLMIPIMHSDLEWGSNTGKENGGGRQ